MRSADPSPRWRRHLDRRVAAESERPRAPLALAAAAGRLRIIGSIEPMLAQELAAAGLPLRDAGDAWRIDGADAASVDATLAAIAAILRAIGRASAWRDELLDVRDAQGELVGAIERAAVRPLGIATQAVHLVVCDAGGDIWLQQRALDKAVDPGLWDTTVGGLVGAGESTADALARETWEEAGLRPEQLARVEHFGSETVRRPLPDGYMVEQIGMFAARAVPGALPANQDGEVARFECVSRAELVARLAEDRFTVEAALVLLRWLDGPGR